jgi:NAD(P)-dependent dehydrogenase (short-subunit alcohol dehydrogenase family)
MRQWGIRAVSVRSLNLHSFRLLALARRCHPHAHPADKIPMKRCGLISEVAALVAFAVSKDASFTTGFTFDATGGRAVY